MFRSALRPLPAALAFCAALSAASAGAEPLCEGYGPQSPRDISAKSGANARLFALAPPASRLNLCNIHFHVNAEHKGPGFSVPGGEGEHGGWLCNETAELTAQEREDPLHGHGACRGLKPGDTVEVHWVHTSCDAAPGAGLTACASETCANPQLRVETQVFLAVNDPAALDFSQFDHASTTSPAALSQPRALPTGFGEPVVFAGSTTGPGYSQSACSPYQVTWSVRPWCARLDIMTLHRWCAENTFEEDHAHGVRQLVVAPELLSPMD